MNKKFLTALVGAAITAMTLSASFAETVPVEQQGSTESSLTQLQAEIKANEKKYASSAKALEAAASVPAPAYIQNGTAAPGLVTTTDVQTAATASIIMKEKPASTDKAMPMQTKQTPSPASTKTPATTGTTKDANKPATTTSAKISPEAVEAAQTGSYQGRKVLDVTGNTITVQGDNRSNKPARYSTAEEAALPDASHVNLPQSTPEQLAKGQAAQEKAQKEAAQVQCNAGANPSQVPSANSYDADLKAIINDPKNAQNKPMNPALYNTAVANSSK